MAEVATAVRVDAAGICWVPVRHHSPAAARVVRELIAAERPAAVLIEGPSDYTRIDQLLLGHRLPISLMCWLRTPEPAEDDDAPSRAPLVAHALYPFTEFSPEWHAIVDGAASGAEVRFIDLPWHRQFLLGHDVERANTDTEAAPLQRTDEVSATFFDRLSASTGRREMSAVWDEIAEIDPHLDADTYLVRAAVLGAGIRADAMARRSGRDDRDDVAREAHMAAQIRSARATHDGVLLVLTGAAHTAALQARLAEPPAADERSESTRLSEATAPAVAEEPVLERGQALVPSSHRELDEHNGYLAGQPSPGFYARVHAAAAHGESAAARVVDDLLGDAIRELRSANAEISTADAIAARATLRGLQQIRAHARPWRDDLLDALASTLVKDTVAVDAETSADGGHPLIRVVRDFMRGDAVGRLAPGTDHPPLVIEVETRCAALGMELTPHPRVIDLDLDDDADRARAQLLHRLRVLAIPAAVLKQDRVGGARRTGALGERATERPDSRQQWVIRGGPDVITAAVLASRHGASIEQATLTVLVGAAGRGIGELTAALFDAVLCGLPDLGGRLFTAVAETTLGVDDLVELAQPDGPLAVLLRLHRFDRWYGVSGREDLGDLLGAVALRAVEIVERVAPTSGGGADQWAAALRCLVDAVLASPVLEELEERLRAALVRQTRRGANPDTGGHSPEMAGAITGGLWLIDSASGQEVADSGPAGVPDPAGVGAWYAGLLAVAGHLAIAAPEIFDPLDAALNTWDDDDFIAALPDLRRAGTMLVPRERRALFAHLRPGEVGLVSFELPASELARLSALEADLWRSVEQHTGPLDALRAPGSAG